METRIAGDLCGTYELIGKENPNGASQLQQILVRDYPSAG